ncbi:MAG: hydrogenase iron-sulfur subunit [Deltaproteobacteria bacterium]|nr:hydrogenase iron-sulfur subunit [Deltaproteobacteria bacterium]
MEKKVGVYICKGCGIGDSLDMEALAAVANDEFSPAVCKDHDFLCSEAGVQAIKGDLNGDEAVNAVVVAACSPRVMQDVFDFGPSVVLDRVNLREQVVWCQPKGEEDTQMMAEDYLRMGITKVGDMEPLEPFQPEEEMSKRLLVVGGGLAGITASTEAAKAGYEVVLVEKEAQLGGWMNKLHKQAPLKHPYTDLEDVDIGDRIKAVEEDGNVTVYTGATMEKIEGAPCLYTAHIKQNGNVVTEKVGAIVVATGAVPYDASNLTHLGFGQSENVITNATMEELASKGTITRPSDGRPVKSAAFILCAGSRDPEHLSYCSSTCCIESLKQAKYLRLQDKDAKAYVIYRDMRTPGHYEYFYKSMQEDEGMFLTKGEVSSVSEDENKNVVLEVDDTLLGEKIQLKVDMVVLATGMVTNAAIGEEVELGLEDDEEGAAELEDVPADTIIKSDMLNLDYRQGPEAPPLHSGFPDSHFICFPYESRRTGIYYAGSVRAPLDGPSTIDDGGGAALKAIQCVELTSKGMALHPRAGDMSYPDFFMDRCTQFPNPTRCRRCGVCMGACPERIISFKNYSVRMIGNLIKSINVPDEWDEKPRFLILACENDAYPALDMVGVIRQEISPWARVIPMRCLGGLNLIWVADTLSKGIDGILLLGCRHGDDYQCHFMTGSELAEIRLSKVAETLDRLALESDRVQLVQLQISEYSDLPRIINEFSEKLDEVGPNPYKGF